MLGCWMKSRIHVFFLDWNIICTFLKALTAGMELNKKVFRNERALQILNFPNYKIGFTNRICEFMESFATGKRKKSLSRWLANSNSAGNGSKNHEWKELRKGTWRIPPQFFLRTAFFIQRVFRVYPFHLFWAFSRKSELFCQRTVGVDFV